MPMKKKVVRRAKKVLKMNKARKALTGSQASAREIKRAGRMIQRKRRVGR